MSTDNIVLVTNVYDQADILGDYLQWYLDLGVTLIIVQDFGSTDDSQDVLDRFARNGRVAWFTIPDKNMEKYDSGKVLATMARDQYDAEWIIQCDADEFLCPQGDDLRAILRNAKNDDFTVLSVPCFNMTGPVLEAGQSAPQTLTLRIQEPVPATRAQRLSGDLPAPYIFTLHLPKTIVRAAAFVEYGPGTHRATAAWGQNGELPQLRFLHYPIRGFDKLQKKVSNTAAWFEANPQLEALPGWAWHWRRWIRLNEQGRLREDYENQFVSSARAEELIQAGTCVVDETVANWLKNKN